MAPKTLIVLRHAKSSWQDPGGDIRRPLAERGILDARAAGVELSRFPLDLVLCSAATRAQQTWQYAQEGGARCENVRFSEAIYHTWPDELLRDLQELDEADATVLLVGHQPTLSELVAMLVENETSITEHFPTTAMAVLSFDGAWQDLTESSATLEAFHIPRA